MVDDAVAVTVPAEAKVILAETDSETVFEVPYVNCIGSNFTVILAAVLPKAVEAEP